eukprot:747175-Hanusia_phi.AAC.4
MKERCHIPTTMREGGGRDMQRSKEEELCGVGLGFFPDDSGRFMVTAVSPYTQARQCGVRAGDQIVKIDGEAIDDVEALTVFRKVFSRKGTEVTFLFRSASNLQRMVTLKRESTALTAHVLPDVYSGLPSALMECGDWERAMHYLREDMKTAMAGEDMRAAAVFCCQMGMVEKQLGLLDESSMKFQNAMNMARTAGDVRTEVVAFERMIVSLIESSGPAQAEARERWRRSDCSGEDGSDQVEVHLTSASLPFKCSEVTSSGGGEVKEKRRGSFFRLYSRMDASMVTIQRHFETLGVSDEDEERKEARAEEHFGFPSDTPPRCRPDCQVQEIVLFSLLRWGIRRGRT